MHGVFSEVCFKPLPGNNLNIEAEILFKWEINYKYLLISLAPTGVQATNGEGTSFFVSWTNLKEYLNLPLFGMFPAYIARLQNIFEVPFSCILGLHFWSSWSNSMKPASSRMEPGFTKKYTSKDLPFECSLFTSRLITVSKPLILCSIMFNINIASLLQS